MVPLHLLWFPILLSAVIVFIVSSLIHMVLLWHKSDYPKIPDEDRVMDALRPFNIPPGEYIVPRALNSTEMRSASFIEKMKKGPVVILSILPNGPVSIAKNLILWFIYSVVIGIFAAYVAGRALPSGAAFLSVFRFTGTTAFLGYSAALWEMSIWYNRSWSMTLKSTLDGLIYALLTASTFACLWPH